MTARLYLWYYTHPRLARPASVLVCVHASAIVAVCAAPTASASTNSMVLGWTGLRDTYGVPIGDYYLAIASVRDQIIAAAPHLGVDPATWAEWMGHVLAVAMGGLAAANILTAEAGMFIGIVALALWLLKVTVSTYWLTVIGEIARAIAGAVVQVTTALGLLMLAVPIGVFAGVVTIKRGEAGRGWTMIGIALTMPAASLAIFSDPAGLMYGPDGLLGVRAPHRLLRRLGRHPQRRARRLAGSGQVERLTASLITRTVREPLQLWNFGHVVDRVGGCGAAWSAAVRARRVRRPDPCHGRLRGPRGGVLRPAPRRHQHLGRMCLHPGRRATGVVHDRFRLGRPAGVDHGDLDHRHPASHAVARRRFPEPRSGAPQMCCGSSSPTASRR